MEDGFNDWDFMNEVQNQRFDSLKERKFFSLQLTSNHYDGPFTIDLWFKLM